MKNKTILLAAIMFLMTSCSKDNNLDMLGMFTSISASSNERFKQSKEYNESHGYDKVIVNQDDYRLYVMSDSHVDFSTNNLDAFVETYLSDAGAAPFALHLGVRFLLCRQRIRGRTRHRRSRTVLSGNEQRLVSRKTKASFFPSPSAQT